MGVTPDRYGGHPGPVWGPGIGIINIGYIELGPYFCLFFGYFLLHSWQYSLLHFVFSGFIPEDLAKAFGRRGA